MAVQVAHATIIPALHERDSGTIDTVDVENRGGGCDVTHGTLLIARRAVGENKYSNSVKQRRNLSRSTRCERVDLISSLEKL